MADRARPKAPHLSGNLTATGEVIQRHPELFGEEYSRRLSESLARANRIFDALDRKYPNGPKEVMKKLGMIED